jgi:hypothetical protein
VSDKVKKDNPNATGKELKTKFGELWKSMSDAEKKPYNDAYMKEKAAYDAAVEKNPDLKGKRSISKSK